MLVSKIDVSEAGSDGIDGESPLTYNLFVIVIDTNSQHGKLGKKNLQKKIKNPPFLILVNNSGSNNLKTQRK